MNSRRDMYINYDRSYNRRRRKSNKRIIIFIIIIALLIGFVAFYIVEANMDDKTGEAALPPKQQITKEPETTPTATPAPLLTSIPTPVPTFAPTPSGMVQGDSDGLTTETDTRSPVKVKGIYVTAPTVDTDYMNKLIHIADTTEINAMVIDVKDDHGKISYKMDSAMAKEIGSTTGMISDMETLIKTLKEKNIYLIARIVAFKDPYLAEKRHDLAVKNPDGSLFRDNNGEGWVNPYNRKVWEYLVEVASEAAKIGFDEIQFDYIRFSTGAGIAKADFGKEAKKKSREEVITEFTRYVCESLKPLGVFVSADVYGTIINSSVDAALVGQDYAQMAKYLDYICPMIYPSHFGEGNYGIQYPDLEPYNIVLKVLLASKEKLDQLPEDEHHAIVRPWLQDFTATWIKHHKKYGPEELREQIKGVNAAGYEEWLLWNSACNYTTKGLEVE